MSASKKRTRKPIKKNDLLGRIEAAKKRIASERDKLRALVEDAETVLGSADSAVENLEAACDHLSQYL
jgi:hypothetical protein